MEGLGARTPDAPRFADRQDAGRQLAAKLDHLKGTSAAVLGLPRGGVCVAYEIAVALGLSLDVILVRKLGVPYQPELALGAVGEDGLLVLNDEVVRKSDIASDDLARIEDEQRALLEERARLYRSVREPVSLDGRVAVVVDDGVATGSTAKAACEVCWARGASAVVLAVPVAPPGWLSRLGKHLTDGVCVVTPPNFLAIGQFYRDFGQVSDASVLEYLRAAPAADRDP